MTSEEQMGLVEDLTTACDTRLASQIKAVTDKHFHILKTARSVFCVSDEKFDRTFLPSSRDFSGKGYLHSLLASRNVMHVKNFNEGGDFRYTFTISLDTQFVSYLRSRFRQRQIVGQDAAITEALRYLAPFRSGLDIMPYLYENNVRLDSPEVAESLECFVQLRYAAEKPLIEEGRIEPTLTVLEQKRKIKDVLSMIKGEDWQALALEAKRHWLVAYITLLHAASIQLAHRNKPASKRMGLLLERLDEVGLFPQHEIHFVNAFFERGCEEDFFRKVQANGCNLISQLQSMAWDIAHYRTIVKQVSHVSRLSPGHAEFVSPYILTFDQPLQTLLKKYSINGLITYLEDNAVKYLVIYPTAVEAALSSGLEEVMHLLEPDRIRQRLQRGKHFFECENRQRDCISQAEASLAAAFG